MMVKNLNFLKNNRVDIHAIWLIITLCSVSLSLNQPWKNNSVITNDKLDYYGYLPAAFTYNDITLKNPSDNFIRNNPMFYYSEGIEGRKVFKMTMGLAMLYLPFFLLAEQYCSIFGESHLGMNEPYNLMIAWSGIFYFLIGLIFLSKLLRRYFDTVTVAFTLITITLATNVFYYLAYNAGMSHVYIFAMLSIMLFKIDQWWDVKTIKGSILIGLIFGWLVLTRPVLIFTGFLFVFWKLFDLSKEEKRQVFFDHYPKIIIAGVFSFVVILPQLIYWKVTTGDFIFYSYRNEGFFFGDPQIFNYIFSFRNGFLPYSPLMLFSFLGLGYMAFKKDRKVISILIVLICSIFVNSSWWCWWYGGAYGNRTMIDYFPILAFGLAFMYSLVFKNLNSIKMYAAAISLTFFVYLSMFQASQSIKCIIHFDSMTKEAYKYIFLQHKGLDYGQLNTLLVHPNYEEAVSGNRDFHQKEVKP